MNLKKIYVKIDDKRERIEDFIADKIFKKLDENDNLDTLQEKVILVAFEAADAYLMTYGVPTLPENVKQTIAKGIVKGSGKANRKIQKQLKKKSDKYKKRHGEE